jgi:hypothetical protein
MLPLVLGPVKLERDDTRVVVAFCDAHGMELRLFLRPNDATSFPTMQRVAPREHPGHLGDRQHEHATDADTTLTWDQAAWLLRTSAMAARDPAVAGRLDSLAELADERRPEGKSPAPSLHELLQSTSDSLFPAELGDREVALDSHDCVGDTPLHVLLWRRDVRGVRMLVAAGADVNAIGDMSETPLHIAVRGGLVEAVATLLAAGADPDIRSEFGETPRECAYKSGDEMADCFKRAGCAPPDSHFSADDSSR